MGQSAGQLSCDTYVVATGPVFAFMDWAMDLTPDALKARLSLDLDTYGVVVATYFSLSLWDFRRVCLR